MYDGETKYVCEVCIEDPCLQEVVRSNVASNECDYCGRRNTKPIACELCDVIKRIRFAIDEEYGPPDEETCYDSEDGDYYGTVHDISEVFEEISFSPNNRNLCSDIVNFFSDECFCKKGLLSGAPSERQMDAWEGFKKVVKHVRRYSFLVMSDDDHDHGIAEYPPSKMLHGIVRTISQFSLVVPLMPATGLWRVRVHDKKKVLQLPIELAAPKAEQAVYSNRMSPAGVAMFYAAEDIQTAWSETVDPNETDKNAVTVGQFTAVERLNILDLCSLPSQNSFFSDWNQSQREALRFIREFSIDLSKPVVKDGKEHVDYVPTQVFSEFIRHEVRTPTGEVIDGIRYRSSKNGGACFVIFADQQDCLPDVNYRTKPQRLRFVEGSALVDRPPPYRKAAIECLKPVIDEFS